MRMCTQTCIILYWHIWFMNSFLIHLYLFIYAFLISYVAVLGIAMHSCVRFTSSCEHSMLLLSYLLR